MTDTAREFTFQVSEGEELTLESAIHQALGAASVCWSTPEGAGVFDSERAAVIGATLTREARRLVGPQLGYATTRQLIDELRARVDLDYTTVYGKPADALADESEQTQPYTPGNES